MLYPSILLYLFYTIIHSYFLKTHLSIITLDILFTYFPYHYITGIFLFSQVEPHAPFLVSIQLRNDNRYKWYISDGHTSTYLPKKELLKWMNSPYEHNTKYPEQLTLKTISGHTVRSKSEALIDMALHVNKIPFRYECALPLSDIVLYPDFTIRHPQTGNFYYWEHFGLMDDLNYS